MVIATGEGPGPRARTGICETSFNSVCLDELSVPSVYKSLSFKERILISRIGLNVRLQPGICSSHLLLRHSAAEHVSLGILKAGVATEIKKMKLSH